MMEEGEQEKRGEGVEQQEEDGEVTGTGDQEGGEAEIEKLNISSPKEDQDEARKSSVEQEMERCEYLQTIPNNGIKQHHPFPGT